MKLFVPRYDSGEYILVDIAGESLLATYSTEELALKKLSATYPADAFTHIYTLEDVAKAMTIAREHELDGIAIDDRRFDN